MGDVMGDVEKSAYRQPVTASGLKAIEKGTLTWLDEDMYNNLNTGVLEQYLEEKNLRESFEISLWNTRKVLVGTQSMSCLKHKECPASNTRTGMLGTQGLSCLAHRK